MFRRLLCIALTALSLFGADATARAQTSPASRSTVGIAPTTYAVLYRQPGEPNWKHRGAYPTRELALAAAQDLYRRGLEVQLRAGTASAPPTAPAVVLPKPKRKASSYPTVTPQQAGQVFRTLANRPDIAFRYVDDGCYARAHLMIEHMLALGMKPARAWTFANGEALHVRRPNDPSKFVTWKYHVAPILRVRFADGKEAWRVIDPSMFDRPVSIATWAGAQRRPNSRFKPHVSLTRLGQAPLNEKRVRCEGSGYWTGKDPGTDLTAYSRMKMREYKAREPRPTRFASPARPAPLPASRRA